MAITNPSSPATYPVTHRMAKVVVTLSAGADIDRHEIEHARIYILGMPSPPISPCPVSLVPEQVGNRTQLLLPHSGII